LHGNAPLEIVVAFAQEVQLKLVTLDGFLAADFAVLFFLTASFADGSALVVLFVVVFRLS
jgi:hypothetical protein